MSLAISQQSLLDIKGFEFTPVSLKISDQVDFKEWKHFGGWLRHVEGAVHWWIGDWLLHGETKWGDKYAKETEGLGFAYKTLANDKSVAADFRDFSRRREKLSFQHHAALQGFEKEEADKWLDRAEAEHWPLSKLRQELRLAKQAGLALPQGQYEVIVIDPPWPYGTEYDPEGRRVASPYPEISVEKLESLKMPAAENTILWLWTTNMFMHDAYHLLEAWEFEPKTILTWFKEKMGIGVWLRGITEHCILATKGSPQVNLTNQTTAISAPRREHSRKPDEFYKMVEELCVGTKRLDMFSREKREGWEQYGNEPDKF